MVVIDTRTNALVRSLCVGGGPFAMATANVPDLPSHLLARITFPAPSFKLAAGGTLPVRVRVGAAPGALRRWTLRLINPDDSRRELASSTGPVNDRVVATLSADALTPGASFSLILDGEDTSGNVVSQRVTGVVPDPQYALIPLEAGNFSRNVVPGVSLDGSGDVVAFGGERGTLEEGTDVFIFDAPRGSAQRVRLALAGDFRLSPDAARLVFNGLFPLTPPYFDPALGILVREGQALSKIQQPPIGPFTLSRTGTRGAFEGVYFFPDEEDVAFVEYFYFDDVAQETRQLTTLTDVIDRRNFSSASTPTISSDGEEIVFATRSTLELVPPDPAVSWRIFRYRVSTREFQQVATLPRHDTFAVPVLSADGRWLTFVTSRPDLPDVTIGARLDVNSGTIDGPIGGVLDYSTSDAVVSGDGSTIVLTTRADLDPRVGNADHNEELFVYDVASGQFTQITDTSGGATGGLPVGSISYSPAVSDDAHALAFTLQPRPGFTCPAAASQRNATDHFFLGRVRAVRKRPGNQAPLLQPLGNTRVIAGQPLALPLSASDPDGDPIVFFTQLAGGIDVPPGSIIEDHHDGTATFQWPTTLENEGTYPLHVAAFDPVGGEAQAAFSVAVCSRILNDTDLAGVTRAGFDSELPVACHDADLNHDGVITAADLVAAAQAAP